MMTDAMLAIFGPYEPCVHVLEDGPVLLATNWGYISTVAVFGICLFSLFRLVGVLFKR